MLWRRCCSQSPAPLGRPVPDWAKVHLELRRKGVTLMLVWHEYKQAFPDGYAYSQFNELYRRWKLHLDVVMRQEHKAGGNVRGLPGPNAAYLRPARGRSGREQGPAGPHARTARERPNVSPRPPRASTATHFGRCRSATTVSKPARLAWPIPDMDAGL